MTPREPDRFDAQARDIASPYSDVLKSEAKELVRAIAAALRAAESSALERAAQAFDAEYLRTGKMHYGYHVAEELRAMSRALIPPAAAPAAECACGPHRSGDAHLCIGDTSGQVARCVCVCHPGAAAETGRAQGAEAYAASLKRYVELEAVLADARVQITELEALLRECNTTLLLAKAQLEQCDEGSVLVDRTLAKLTVRAAQTERNGK